MSAPTKKQPKQLTKGEKKKRGFIYLVVAVVSFLIYMLFPQTNTLGSRDAVMLVSTLQTLVVGVMMVFLVGGIVYLINGFKKTE